jgi:hypothetical protein
VSAVQGKELPRHVDGWQTLLMQLSPDTQHVAPALQEAPEAMQAVVEVVLDEVLVDVVPLTHTVAVVNDEAGGQPAPQACPAAQQVRLAPLPQGVRPAGQPHSPRARSTHAIPV